MFINVHSSRQSPVEVKPANERIRFVSVKFPDLFTRFFVREIVVLWSWLTCGLRVVRIIEWKLGVSSIIAVHCGKINTVYM